MKIGFLLSSFYPATGGREVITFNQARELAKRGHEVHIFTTLKDNWKKEEVVEGLHIHRTKTYFQYKYYLEFNPGWIKNVMKYKLDILHIQSFGFIMADIAVLLKKAFSKTKILNTPHGPFMALQKYPWWQEILKVFYTIFEYPVNMLYDAVVEVNPEQWKWMTKVGVNKKRIKFIPNSIPKEIFKKVNVEAFKKKQNLSNKLVISYLGRIQKYKGLDQVIKVLPDLVKENSNVCFLAMGKDAGDLSRLKKLTKELNVEKNVVFASVDDEERLAGLEVSEIFVLPSEWEAFGICVDPNTFINTLEGVKEIKDIKVRDKVLTHKGRFMKVKKTMKRKINSTILEIISKNDNLPLKITPQHPILAVKSNSCSRKHKKKYNVVCRPSCMCKNHCASRYYENYKVEWINAQDLRKGDYIAYTFNDEVKDLKGFLLSKFVDFDKSQYFEVKEHNIVSKTGHNLAFDISYDKIAYALNLGRGTIYRVINSHSKVKPETRKKVLDYLKKINYKVMKITIPKFIPLNNSTLRLFGYYIAEGNVGSNGQIEFSFHIKEKAYVLDVLRIMGKYFNLKGRVRKRSNNGVSVGFNSVIIAKLFKKLFGGHAGEKRVPKMFMGLTKDKQVNLLKGYWRGDGSVSPTGFTIGTKSPNLAYQFRDILLRLHITASLNVFNRKKFGNFYVLAFGGVDLEKVSNYLGFKHPFIKKKKRNISYNWIDGNKYFMRINSINKIDYNGLVYNLEVEKDNSYVGQSKTMHNCIIEAMARNNAIISTKTEGGNFLIEEGKNGYLYDYKDTNEIRKHLLKLIKDNKLRHKIIETNYVYSKEFLTEKIAKQLEDLYKKVLKEN